MINIKIMASTHAEVLRKYYPGGIYGFDLDGRPIYYEPLGGVDFVGILHSVKMADVVNYKRSHCIQLRELCKAQEEKLGKELGAYSTLVLDADGGGRKHLWRPGLDTFKACLALYEDEFPDLRKHIIIINVPIIFPIIFAIIKPLLSQSTKDKIKVLGGNWRTQILKYIDKDNLPEIYGGNCKDTDDNPRCEEFICFGGEVPTSYYSSESVCREEFENVTIKAGCQFIKEIEITEMNSSIKYQFITNNFDIKFYIEFQPAESSEKTTLKEEQKFHSELTMEEGTLLCESVGKYMFIFDNSYSWVRQKELYFLIQSISSTL